MFDEKNKKFGFSPRFLESSIVIAHENTEITSLSTSKLFYNNKGKLTADLLTRNFNVWLTGFFTSVAQNGERSQIMINESSLSRTVKNVDNANNGGVWNDTGLTVDAHTSFQLGKGTTAVDRDDFTIETPFSVGDQASKFKPAASGGWNSGTGIVTTSGTVITSTLGGTIGEVGLFGHFGYSGGEDDFMLCHDNVNTVFTAGQSVTVEYSFQL